MANKTLKAFVIPTLAATSIATTSLPAQSQAELVRTTQRNDSTTVYNPGPSLVTRIGNAWNALLGRASATDCTPRQGAGASCQAHVDSASLRAELYRNGKLVATRAFPFGTQVRELTYQDNDRIIVRGEPGVRILSLDHGLSPAKHPLTRKLIDGANDPQDNSTAIIAGVDMQALGHTNHSGWTRTRDGMIYNGVAMLAVTPNGICYPIYLGLRHAPHAAPQTVTKTPQAGQPAQITNNYFVTIEKDEGKKHDHGNRGHSGLRSADKRTETKVVANPGSLIVEGGVAGLKYHDSSDPTSEYDRLQNAGYESGTTVRDVTGIGVRGRILYTAAPLLVDVEGKYFKVNGTSEVKASRHVEASESELSAGDLRGRALVAWTPLNGFGVMGEAQFQGNSTEDSNDERGSYDVDRTTRDFRVGPAWRPTAERLISAGWYGRRGSSIAAPSRKDANGLMLRYEEIPRDGSLGAIIQLDRGTYSVPIKGIDNSFWLGQAGIQGNAGSISGRALFGYLYGSGASNDRGYNLELGLSARGVFGGKGNK